MTYLEAALHVLRQSHGPLHYSEITRRALAANLITPAGVTPEATMASRLYSNTNEADSEFIRVGKGLFDLTKSQPTGIDAEVQRINAATRAKLRELLLAMPPDRFEALITELLIQMGFDEQTVQVTPYKNDGGIDVVGVYRAAGLTEVNAAVQAKRWSYNVQAPTVQKVRGSLNVQQQGIIITTSDFSVGARNEAKAPGKARIGLINGEELLDLLIKHRVGVEERQLKVISLDEEWWHEVVTSSSDSSGEVNIEEAKQLGDTPAMQQTSSESANSTGMKPVAYTLFDRTQPIIGPNNWTTC